MMTWILFNGDDNPLHIFFVEEHMHTSIEQTYKKMGQKITLSRRYIDYMEWTLNDGTRVLWAKRVVAQDHVIQL